MTRVAIALGSNLGDRRAHLQFAISRLRTILTDVRVSSIHETAPEGVDGPQPDYLNAVVAGFTTLSPIALLQTLLAIERERGRTRPSLRASRTLDLDLILYGDAVIDTPELTVPHPRYLERQFVTKPLAEVWGN
ncbi:MAG TPA: 2-amino-4-hydroxy-6-hydroxymethyldihydropteridine diphosphokinase [Vicinamibacterales bacterium]|nr:2-amino-4-hydroxy-6-hydroxymethyldihydropteridine diphosphokinase [Vicinamibacterales bacterium]